MIPPNKCDPESPKKTFLSFLKLKYNNKIDDIDNRIEKFMNGVMVSENISNKQTNISTIDIAKPSIPSIKLIAFIIATIINMVNKLANSLLISNKYNTPCKLSIIKPLSTIILAAII